MNASDRFFPAEAHTLLAWILHDLPRGQVFGVPRSLFFTPRGDDPFRLTHHGELLETPLGAAAGPHTQLAQNIVSAWLCGARFIELKTVQARDGLSLPRPCIEASDEGYNCEWSQELRLEESFGQYLSAMALIRVLRVLLNHPEHAPDQGPGFVFNMSAGYDLEGVKTPGMARFLDRMTHCPEEARALADKLAPLHPAAAGLSLPDFVSRGLTLSTMHGCPPGEIERIALHFMEDRGLDVSVKLNPTLLGAETVRGIVNTRLGYAAHVPDEAFAHDLAYPQAVELIESLRARAAALGVRFGVKLTNTLEVLNPGNLPGGERMVYLSGRALHPVSVNLAAKLRATFGPSLPISFCAGVDAFNAARVARAGLAPVTICTDLLKPGGYGRLRQCVEALREAAPARLADYAAATLEDPRYRKAADPWPTVKTGRPLPAFDCALAPCVQGCAAGQDVPGYLAWAARGDFAASLAVILETNPFPNLLGASCDRLCRTRCTRTDMDRPLRIREIKRVAAREGAAQASPRSSPQAGPRGRVHVRGSGLAGLACAWWLALAGLEAVVHGPRPSPDDRLLETPAGRADLEAILALGVVLSVGDAPPDSPDSPGALDALVPAKGQGGLPGAVALGRALAAAHLESLGAAGQSPRERASLPDLQALGRARAWRDMGPETVETPVQAAREAARCLRCGEVCNACVTVCPNRANVAVPWGAEGMPASWSVQRAVAAPGGARVEQVGEIAARQAFQVVNIGDFCNECGNCEPFCPSAGAPWRDKPRLHLSRESFEAAGRGAWFSAPGVMEAILDGTRVSAAPCPDVPDALMILAPGLTAVLDAAGGGALRVELSPGADGGILALAGRAALLYALASKAAAFSWNNEC